LIEGVVVSILARAEARALRCAGTSGAKG